MSFCSNCGAQIMVGNQYCSKCRKPAPGVFAADPQVVPLPSPAADPEPNVYAAPKANLETYNDTSGLNPVQLEQMRSGQRMVIAAIAISFLMIPFNMAPMGELAIVTGIVAFANLFLIAIGMWRLARGHGYGAVVSFLAALGGIVPLIGIILMIGLSISATGKLRKAGYTVGFLGAKKKEPA